MTQIHSGSCNCQRVRFELRGTFEHFFLCHCQRCQKGTGSAHASNLFSSQGKLIFFSGEEQITLFRYPESRHTKAFCQICGSGLPYIRESGQGVVVPAGSLDSPLNIQADAHIFLADKASWDHHPIQAPGFESYPELKSEKS